MARRLLCRIAWSTAACFTLINGTAQTAPAFHFEFTEEAGRVFRWTRRSWRSMIVRAAFRLQPLRPGDSAASDGPRPLQTLIWYPAKESSGATMTFGACVYGALIKTETSFDKPVAQGKPQSFVEAFLAGHKRSSREGYSRCGHAGRTFPRPGLCAERECPGDREH